MAEVAISNQNSVNLVPPLPLLRESLRGARSGGLENTSLYITLPLNFFERDIHFLRFYSCSISLF